MIVNGDVKQGRGRHWMALSQKLQAIGRNMKY
jgi:hypothetical protein